MKKENTAIRLKKIMDERGIRQVDILNLAAPYCEKYNVKMNKSDLSQYCSGKTEPNQDKLFVLGAALNVNEAWLMGYDVPMERNDYEDPNILIRDAELEEIDKILKSAGYSLCCENYDDDFFIIKNAYGQTVASFYNYELLARYRSLKKKHKLTAKLLISSESAFFKYLESLGYYIGKDDPEHKPFIHYGNGAIQIGSDELNNIRTRIDTYTKATLDSFILRLNEDGIRRERLEKEKVIKQLQASQFEKDWNKAHLITQAAHERTDIEVTDEMRKHDDDLMDNDDFWNK
ncbi:hypothetical protein [Lacrimispora sp. 210928-DFI.3.58]|uniref:hypothetical protein n=1 Tax=Lacrimispora sp. 210928-DFI.3.58 TaxID=2883214 RepID=UPI001D074077|nr:hypothetical protein [Lacrimispora sp. 210928-DFI.3.58]MCB7320146.1 hypothetical protein [Lacrimispora sp. 210928-DFI.3.58]